MRRFEPFAIVVIHLDNSIIPAFGNHLPYSEIPGFSQVLKERKRAPSARVNGGIMNPDWLRASPEETMAELPGKPDSGQM
jgi:hypothetical protein